MKTPLLAIALLLCISAPAMAETTQESDARIEQQLEAADRSTVILWKKANAARDAERHADAVRLYAEVFRRVPTFVPALRREAGEELILNRRDLALPHMREAIGIERSPENMAMLAFVLASGTPGAGDLAEAKQVALEATKMKPDDLFAHAALAQVALAVEDIDLLAKVADDMERIAPKHPQTYVVRTMVEVSRGKWDASRAALEYARAGGLPQEQYEELSQSVDSATPFYIRWWKPAVIALAVGLAMMLTAGSILSRSALRAAQTPPTDLAESASGPGNSAGQAPDDPARGGMRQRVVDARESVPPAERRRSGPEARPRP